jgi:hypothetical protein
MRSVWKLCARARETKLAGDEQEIHWRQHFPSYRAAHPGCIAGYAVRRKCRRDAGPSKVKRTLITLHIASTRARRLIAPLTATIIEYGMTNLPNVFRIP